MNESILHIHFVCIIGVCNSISYGNTYNDKEFVTLALSIMQTVFTFGWVIPDLQWKNEIFWFWNANFQFFISNPVKYNFRYKNRMKLL